MKKKFVRVFVDLSDDENENNFQSKIEKYFYINNKFIFSIY